MKPFNMRTARDFMVRELAVNADAYGGAVDVSIKLASIALEHFEVGDVELDPEAEEADAIIWEVAMDLADEREATELTV